MTWTDLAFWQAALAGAAEPPVLMLVLALTTLLLEDLAIAAGAALAAQGLLSWPLAFVAVAGGIAAGDLMLYGLGALARRMPLLQRRFIGARSDALRHGLHQRLASAVLLARVIPGLRLVTYTASGFLSLPLAAFTGWVLLAVALWTAALFALAGALGAALAQVLPIPLPLAVALPIVVFALALMLMRRRAPSRSFT